MKTLLVAVVLALSVPSAVSIKLDKYVLLAGGALTVVCHIPPAPEARWLEIGIDDVPSRTLQLDGQSSPFELLVIKNIACGQKVAYCAIGTGKHPSDLAFATFIVGGCDEGRR